MDLEDLNPSLNQFYLGCTQRGAEVAHEAVKCEMDLFRRITTTEVTNKKHGKSGGDDSKVSLFPLSVMPR